ncbi:MAG TPA: MlaD family protein [Solirubrobacteraceae bacterium]|nr:MlaD family protein [Solirubrobacteraceae bacterium]
MNNRGMTRGQVAIALVFALSCFGLLLFLWTSFGGAIPLAAKGYRIDVVFPSAPLLAEQADVRIAGVPVGKVEKIVRAGRDARVTLQIASRYAPLHAGVRAVIRRKTLLGEGYVELAPGSPSAPALREGATVPASHVSTPAALDQILATFDPRTRRDLQIVVQGLAAATRGRAASLNDAAGHLGDGSAAAASLLDELRAQRGAVASLTRDAGQTFAAIGAHEARVADLIRNGDALFAATAASDRSLSASVHALPGLLGALRSASGAAQRAAVPLAPLLRELRPAARALPGTIAATRRIAPQLRAIAAPLDRVTAAAPRGLGAAGAIVDAAGPLVDRLYPLGRQLVPMIDFAWTYRRELSSFAKVAAAMQAQAPGADGTPIHYLRSPIVGTVAPFTKDPEPEPYARLNAYLAPGGLAKFLTGPIEAFDCRNTANPEKLPPLGSSPPCVQQQPWTFRGVTAAYPHLRPAP